MGGSLGKSKSKNQNQMQFQGGDRYFDRGGSQMDSGTNIQNNNVTGAFGNQNVGSNAFNQGQTGSFGDQSGVSNQQDLSTGRAGAGQNVWGAQGDALGGLYGQTGNLMGQSMQGAGGQMAGGQQFSQDAMNAVQNPWEQQMQGGVYSGLGIGNQLMQSLQQSQNNPSAMQEVNSMIMGGEGNNYADAMRDQYVQDANRASDNMMRNLDARAAHSGMSGSARHGVAQALGMDDINRNLQGNMAQTGLSTFDKDLDRKLQIAGQADQGTLARQDLMSGLLGNQQGAMDTGIAGGQGMVNMGFGQQMMPWQQLGAAGGIMGGPTVLDSSFDNTDTSGINSTIDVNRTGSFGQDTGGSQSFDRSQTGSFGQDFGTSNTWDRGRNWSDAGGKSSMQGSGSGSGRSKGLGLAGGK